MSFDIKDRVVLKSDPHNKGTIIRIQKKGGQVRSCAVLWDNEWPSNDPESKKFTNGRLFYYKTEDLVFIDTWRE